LALMASRKRSRPRGGHPAKVAERRERDRSRREAPRDPALRLARRICHETAGLESALDAELWASHLLGSFWPPDPFAGSEQNAEVELGAPLVERLARIGGQSALAALVAIAEVAETELGPMARAAADKLRAGGVAPPAWGNAIEEAEVLATAVMREEIFDDGITVFVEARHDDGPAHAIGVYVDHNLGGMAKDILLADSIAAVEDVVSRNRDEERDRIVLEPISPQEASVRIHEAMELTDMTLEAPVSDGYAGLRALALLRAAELPGPPIDVSHAECSPEEREALLEDFLASPEAAGFDAAGDEAFIASLAIDYAADYQGGGPLRWSPVTVELFMTGWLPRKVVADRGTFDAVPRSLDAWVRYAGRRRELPAWAIETVTGAISEWTAEMFDQVDAPGTRGAGAEFVAAATAAGVDLTNEQALASFVAGWNARSRLP
jgi:hypothetical protein